jgi:adenylyltransferase/sulfurtransferase
MDTEKYKGQINIPEHGIKGQELLMQSHAIILGAGGLGCPVLINLIRAGVSNISIVDNDVVEESNLSRQFIYSEKDIGEKKIDCLQKHLRDQFTEIEINYIDQNAYDIDYQQYNVIIDCTDDIKLKYLTSKKGKELNTPYITGSVFRFLGQVYSINNRLATKYEISDVFPESNENNSCSLVGIYGTHCMLIGSVIAQETIRQIIEPNYDSKFIVLDSKEYYSKVIHISDLPKDKGSNQNYRSSDEIYLSKIDAMTLDSAYKLGLTVIDVRATDEYDNLPSGFKNIPMSRIVQEDKPEEYKNTVFVCASGYRAKLCAHHVNSKLGGNFCKISSI